MVDRTSALAVKGQGFAPWAAFLCAVVLGLSGIVETAPAADRARAGPLAGCEEIIFAQRVSGHDHRYANFGHYSDGRQGHYAPASTPGSVEYFRYAFGDGGRLCRFNVRTRKLTVPLDDPEGGARDPHVHYDGHKILFSYRRGGTTTYRDPYPLSKDLFLVAGAKGIHCLTGDGHAELVYAPKEAGARWQCHEPRPLRASPREAILSSRFAPEQATGRLVLSDISTGRNMAGVETGEIKKLLVLEQLPKPGNSSGGSEPLTVGGTLTLQRVLGTVPVEAGVTSRGPGRPTCAASVCWMR